MAGWSCRERVRGQDDSKRPCCLTPVDFLHCTFSLSDSSPDIFIARDSLRRQINTFEPHLRSRSLARSPVTHVIHFSTSGFHAHRTACRDCDHLGLDCALAARGAIGPRSGAAGPVHQQHEATGVVHAQLPQCQRLVPLGNHQQGRGPGDGLLAVHLFGVPEHPWFCLVLGQVEQGNLYNSFNFSLGMEGPSCPFRWASSPTARYSAPR